MRILNLTLMIVSLAVSLGAQAQTIQTKELQIVVPLTDPEMFFYRSNIGGEITGDLTVTNPAGSTYVFKGGLFPGGTVDPAQFAYNYDTEGSLLTAARSIGTWVCTGTRLIDWNLTGLNYPPENTLVEEVSWSFLFKGANPDESNAVYAKGWLSAGTFGVGADFTVSKFHLGVIGGTGLNDSPAGVVSARSYLASDGMSVLTVVRFSKSISIDIGD